MITDPYCGFSNSEPRVWMIAIVRLMLESFVCHDVAPRRPELGAAVSQVVITISRRDGLTCRIHSLGRTE